MATKECVACNTGFEVKRNKHAKFCSKKECRKEYKRQYYLANKVRLKKGMADNYAKRMQDPEYKKKWNQKSKARRDANPVMVNCQNCGKEFRRIKYNRNCSEKCSREWKTKQSLRPLSRLSGRLNLGIRRVVKGIRKKDTVWDYFDFTPNDFIERFESLFIDGMSWDNMAEWHIDHIRPIASFNYDSTDHPDFKKCWALNNLQPLWAKDNLSKSNKWDGVVNA